MQTLTVRANQDDLDDRKPVRQVDDQATKITKYGYEDQDRCSQRHLRWQQ